MSKVLLARYQWNYPWIRDRVDRSSFALLFFGTLWCIPVGMTIFGVGQASVALVTQAISILCFVFMIKYPSTVLIGLPFFALLAPVGGFVKFAGISAVVTDWLMLGLGLNIFVSYRGKLQENEGGFFKGPIVKYLNIMVFLYLISCIIGVMLGSLISFVPLYYLLAYFIIYYYSDRFGGTYAHQRAILDGWCLASIIASAILLQAFLEGKLLVNFATDDADLTVDRFFIEHIFQATYYYSGFNFIVGILSTGLSMRLIFSRESLQMKAGIIAALIFFFMVMAVALNRTAIVAMIISFLIVYGMVSVRLRRFNLLIFVFAIIFFPYFIFSLVEQFGSVLYWSSDNYYFSATSTSSFLVRVEVWTNAFLELLRQPWFIPFGLGPNAIEAGNQEISELFKMSRVTGQIEGALDSTWLTYLLEFGVIGFLLVIGIFYRCFLIMKDALWNMPRDQVTNPVFIMVLSGLVYLVFAFVSQSLGYTKISWLPFQMLLIVSAYGSIASSSK